ncbi:MAG: AraC family transcriptional regulator [Flavobacteriaceae bacterium]|nr:AraC family transcriptional regulator [Flavobacteriaceae bacterium]
MVTHDVIYGIQKACYSESSKAGEYFIKESGVFFIVSGTMEAFDGKDVQVYKKGDIVLFRKNALIRFEKYVQPDKVFEAISIVLDDSLLQDFTCEYGYNVSNQLSKDTLFKVKKDELLMSYFATIKSYFVKDMTEELILLKKKELIHLLLRNDNSYQDVLFNFAAPGKIDLEAFMNSNYKFNVPLTQFAFLTGRSLATFKRDFEKVFHNSPSRWLKQKRLEEAYYLLKNKKMKVKEVYADVGFETLSHFSYSFKEYFGIPPSNL